MKNKNDNIEEYIKQLIREYQKENIFEDINIYEALNKEQQLILENFGIKIENKLYSQEECILIKMILRAQASLQNKFKEEVEEIIDILFNNTKE